MQLRSWLSWAHCGVTTIVCSTAGRSDSCYMISRIQASRRVFSACMGQRRSFAQPAAPRTPGRLPGPRVKPIKVKQHDLSSARVDARCRLTASLCACHSRRSETAAIQVNRTVVGFWRLIDSGPSQGRSSASRMHGRMQVASRPVYLCYGLLHAD